MRRIHQIPNERSTKKALAVFGLELLRGIVSLAVIFCVGTVWAQESPARKYGFNNASQIPLLPANSYRLVFLRSEPDEFQGRMGFFTFRHTLEKPIQMWGFGFERDGSFRVRFERFSKIGEYNWWNEERLGVCGTGREAFALEPNHDYVARVPLWPYTKSGARGVVLLSGPSHSVLSDEFDCAPIRQNAGKVKVPSK